MPFQSWEIRPHGLNSCIFTIVAAAIDLEIEVKVGVTYLVLASCNAVLLSRDVNYRRIL